MKTLLLIGFFACLYLHFQKQDAVVEQLDVLSTKQSAVKKMPMPQVERPAITHIQTPVEEKIAESESSEDMITDEDLAMSDENTEFQIPWDEVEEGWKTNLREYLVSVDPDKADEMFAAYLEEKKKYVDRIDFSDAESGAMDDPEAVKNSEPMLVESDAKEDDLQRSHSDNLKDIFGDHYSAVEALHKEYVDSVQYLNRDSQKFSISF